MFREWVIVVLWFAILWFTLWFSLAFLLPDLKTFCVKMQPPGSTVPCSLCLGPELRSWKEQACIYYALCLLCQTMMSPDALEETELDAGMGG